MTHFPSPRMTSDPSGPGPYADPRTEDPSAVPSSTAVLDREVHEEEAEAGDHDRFAHYVRKDKILKSALGGNAVVALCGKVWVPGRDPSKYPVCPECKAILDEMKHGEDGGDGSGKGKGNRGGGGFRGLFGRN